MSKLNAVLTLYLSTASFLFEKGFLLDCEGASILKR